MIKIVLTNNSILELINLTFVLIRINLNRIFNLVLYITKTLFLVLF